MVSLEVTLGWRKCSEGAFVCPAWDTRHPTMPLHTYARLAAVTERGGGSTRRSSRRPVHFRSCLPSLACLWALLLLPPSTAAQIRQQRFLLDPGANFTLVREYLHSIGGDILVTRGSSPPTAILASLPDTFSLSELNLSVGMTVAPGNDRERAELLHELSLEAAPKKPQPRAPSGHLRQLLRAAGAGALEGTAPGSNCR